MTKLERDNRSAEPTSYGESAADILTTLAKGDRRMTKAGRYQLNVEMSSAGAGPFVRALMRAEAELLLLDADDFDSDVARRTPDQRRVDALLNVAKAASEALAGQAV